MTTVVLAGVSVRAMAESARRGGLEAIALDAFGDEDTRAACRRWESIAGPRPFEIDPQRFVAALEAAAAESGVCAWIPGAGFESQPQAIGQGAAILPMAGTAADDVQRLRDARAFFAELDAAGVDHPPVRFEPVDDARGWLAKDAGGCGGWHVRPAETLADGVLPPGHYLQRQVDGAPMSATFLADGNTARVLGINRQRVRHFGTRHHVFRGVTGPVAIGASAMEKVRLALRRLIAAYRIKGLGSLDFMLDGERVAVLEINPRPPASFPLHERGDSLVAAHLDICLHGRWPSETASDGTVRGTEIVYARRAFTLGPEGAAHLARRRCHDRPAAGSRFEAGDPVCTLEADGPSADEVDARLAAGREELLDMLESTT